MSENLRECPFCGGEAEFQIFDNICNVVCAECHIGTRYESLDSVEQVVAAWNTRTDYHGYEQAAIEAWESIKAWNTRAERTCHNVNINGYSLRFECSACGFASITTNCETRMDEMPKHCPNCGRKVVDE